MDAINKLTNLMRQQASQVLSTRTDTTRVGIITSYNKENYTAKVLIQPEEILTGWWPILTPWVGNNWGLMAAPTIGDQVVVHFQEGNISTGFIGDRIFNSQDVAPNPGPDSGEIWIVHKTGTFLKFMNDGTIQIQALDEDGNPSTLNIIANVIVTGTISATGDVLDNSQVNTDTMKGMRTIYNAHTHNTPAGLSSSPNQPE